jgi:1H-pyrrole-2-carbonyl-[peptidyl-carrier protein] chlorinase
VKREKRGFSRFTFQENVMMVNIEQPDFDIGIIGGGPAGSSLAAYLAKAGISCVVFESDLFPRPHVGESLVPAANRVLKELDFMDKMEEAKFPHKYGAVWTSVTNDNLFYEHDWDGLSPDCYVDIRFDERKMEGFNQKYTYHVDRGKFDLLLLQHAHQLGAAVYEGVRVKRVDFSNGQKSGDASYPQIVYSIGKRETRTSVRLVVDASGRRTLLGNQLKLKTNDPIFNQFALHTWFEGYDRGMSDQQDYIFVHFLPISNSWVWQIPITDTITSFGIVTQKRDFPKDRELRRKFFWDCLNTQPELSEKLHKAKQIRPFTAEGDYSYAMKQFCGDGYVLIGDAARFVDPIFSSGVSVALNSARLASHDILQTFEKSTLKNGVFERAALRTYETTLRWGTKNWYEFITLYYRLNILFTTFVRDPRYRIDILKLLQGDVYDEEEPPVLKRMRDVVTAVEQNPNHLWHQMLGDLTANAFKPQSN